MGRKPTSFKTTMKPELRRLIRSWVWHQSTYRRICAEVSPYLNKKSDMEKLIQSHLNDNMVLCAQISQWHIKSTLSMSKAAEEACKAEIEKECRELGPFGCLELLWVNIKKSEQLLIDYYEKHNLRNIQSLVGFARYCLQLCSKDSQIGLFPSSFNPIQVKDIRPMANMAVSSYLEHWISADHQYRDSIYHFVKSPYDLPGTKCNLENADEQDYRLRQWRIVMREKWEPYHALWRLQQDSNITLIAPGLISAQKHSILSLTWCAIWEKGGFRVLEYYLFRRKNLNLQTGTSHEAHDDRDLLRKSWQSHYQYLEELEQMWQSGTPSPADKRRYVLECITLQRYEMENSHHLLCQAAQYLQKKQRKTVKPRFHTIAMALWSPFSMDLLDLPYPIPAVQEPVQVMQYDDALETLYGTWKRPEALRVLKYATLQRLVLTDLIIGMKIIFPPKKMPTWTDPEGVHFEAAAHFYHKEYNFVQDWLEHKPAAFAEKASKEENEGYFRYYDALLADFHRQDAHYETAVSWLKCKNKERDTKKAGQTPDSAK